MDEHKNRALQLYRSSIRSIGKVWVLIAATMYRVLWTNFTKKAEDGQRLKMHQTHNVDLKSNFKTDKFQQVQVKFRASKE